MAHPMASPSENVLLYPVQDDEEDDFVGGIPIPEQKGKAPATPLPSRDAFMSIFFSRTAQRELFPGLFQDEVDPESAIDVKHAGGPDAPSEVFHGDEKRFRDAKRSDAPALLQQYTPAEFDDGMGWADQVEAAEKSRDQLDDVPVSVKVEKLDEKKRDPPKMTPAIVGKDSARLTVDPEVRKRKIQRYVDKIARLRASRIETKQKVWKSKKENFLEIAHLEDREIDEADTYYNSLQAEDEEDLVRMGLVNPSDYERIESYEEEMDKYVRASEDADRKLQEAWEKRYSL
jgi:hypothetical protein